MMRFIQFTLIACLYIRNGAADSALLRDYDAKVCRNEPTCHMADQQNLPLNRRNFIGRDCMCDFECVEFDDCCKDSEFYGAQIKRTETTYQCHKDFQVYMIVTCPSGYDDVDTKAKCENSINSVSYGDLSITRPATNMIKRITYGNIYCALCNKDLDVELWDLAAGCGEAPDSYSNELNSYQQNVGKRASYDSENNKVASAPTYNTNPFGYGTQVKIPGFDAFQFQLNRYTRQANFGGVNFQKHSADLDKILRNVRYDSGTNSYVSRYNNVDFVCKFETQPLKDIDLRARRCVPDLISTCPPNTDKETSDLCTSYTAVTYDQTRAYKNKDCARCNYARLDQLNSCAKKESRIAASSLFSIKNKAIGGPCTHLELKNKFC